MNTKSKALDKLVNLITENDSHISVGNKVVYYDREHNKFYRYKKTNVLSGRHITNIEALNYLIQYYEKGETYEN